MEYYYDDGETIDTINEYVKCPFCDYEHAIFQHEPNKTLGILNCPNCEKLAD